MTRLLTAREVAEDLAMSPKTVLAWANAGKLPAFRLPSGALRFREADLEVWLEARQVGVQDSRLSIIKGGADA